MPRAKTTPRPPGTATTQSRPAYQTDLTDAQWDILRPLLPPPPGGGRPRTTDMRGVLNAILYSLRTGAAWDLPPHDFPPPGTVYGYSSNWRGDGTIERIHDTRSGGGEEGGRRSAPKKSADGRESIGWTAPEVRRLLVRLLWSRLPEIEATLNWSERRRAHQAFARRCHYKKRGSKPPDQVQL